MMSRTGNQSYQLTMKDGYHIIIILILYGLLSFFHLGTTDNPQSFWQAQKAGEQIVLDLGQERQVSKLRYYTGARFGTFSLATSHNSIAYEPIEDLKEEKVFAWKEIDINKTFRYLKIESKTDEDRAGYGSFGEIGLYDEKGELVPITGMDEISSLVCDEQDVIPEKISYLNSTYFDEIYHGRTAYEYIHGMTIYEWTHPPLGKLLMTIPIRLWGMNTFSYRFMGNIAGLLMLLVIYIFAKRLFKSTTYATVAMGVFALDGMHFVQTRIGTVDSFLVLFIMLAYLFMYQYMKCDSEREVGKMHLNLLCSGIFLGCAIATKWNGAYTALGLAILFFISFFERNNEHRFISGWKQTRIKIILMCFVYFIFIPIGIYLLSYIPDMKINPEYKSIEGFVNLQLKMYHYHADLEATHPFGSSWYLWPLGIKPVWYYDGKVGEGYISTIVAHSNPFIWWTGIIAILYTIVKAIIDREKRYVSLTIAVLVAYLPYVFISRVMFLYHYFPVVPFMILSIVGALKDLEESTKIKWYKAYVTIAAILFVFFYPIYSGLTIPRWYANLTQWLPQWHFFN